MDEAGIAALELARRVASVAADRERLGDLLSDDLLWTHANGGTQDKASYLAALGIHARFLDMQPVEQTIAIYGGVAAAVAAELVMTIKPNDKDPVTLRTRASSVWTREADGFWRLTRFHSGMVT